MGKRKSDEDQPGWLSMLVSAIVQGLVRAAADLLVGRGGKGLL